MPAKVFDFDKLELQVKEVLRETFPEDTIEISKGYKGRVHVLVVSSKFNDMTDRQKQDFIWEILKAELEDEVQAVSLALVYGTDELR
jgi:acid stress-induced BolA-like protein IbaG/YrbA